MSEKRRRKPDKKMKMQTLFSFYRQHKDWIVPSSNLSSLVSHKKTPPEADSTVWLAFGSGPLNSMNKENPAGPQGVQCFFLQEMQGSFLARTFVLMPFWDEKWRANEKHAQNIPFKWRLYLIKWHVTKSKWRYVQLKWGEVDEVEQWTHVAFDTFIIQLFAFLP